MALGLVWASISLGVFATIFLLDKMGAFRSKNMFPVEGRTILITGGSQGMGKALAQLLASKGANVVIVARDVQKLEAALEDTRRSAANLSNQRFHFISADLTSPTEAQRILNETSTWNDGQPPDHVMCVAGACHPGYFVDVDPSILKTMVDTNYLSAAYIAQATCNAWLSRPFGINAPKKPIQPRHIVFVSSLAALIPLAGYAPYSPAKAALHHLSQVLSQELLLYEEHTPMRTHCVLAGAIFSPGLEKENETKPGITKKLEEGDGGNTPDEIALTTLKALEKGDENITAGLQARAMKAGSLGGTRRNGSAIVDTLLSWVMSLVFIFVRKDMDAKVRAWGKEKRLGARKAGP